MGGLEDLSARLIVTQALEKTRLHAAGSLGRGGSGSGSRGAISVHGEGGDVLHGGTGGPVSEEVVRLSLRVFSIRTVAVRIGRCGQSNARERRASSHSAGSTRSVVAFSPTATEAMLSNTS